jgi:nitrite reductase (NO-forming)
MAERLSDKQSLHVHSTFRFPFSIFRSFYAPIVYPGSWISHPASRIPHPGSRIHLPLSVLLFFSLLSILHFPFSAFAADAITLTPTAAPNVPPPIKRTYPELVKIELEATEFRGTLADGTEYQFWGYNGRVPGPFIRVREGDVIVLTLKNNDHSKFPHSIDLHAVTGPGGGAKVTQTLPGEQSTFTWKALHPGLFVYHCATPHVPTHIANGMYGLILVEPAGGHILIEPGGGLIEQPGVGSRVEGAGGLIKVDHEFYIMQGEFYTQGAHGAKGLQAFSLEKAEREQPDYVVFNGRDDSLTGEGALKVKVGERVRLFVGNGGPNLTSAFHIIGEIFDQAFPGGALGSPAMKNVQTVPIPPGDAAIIEFTANVPGTYLLVDHSIVRAFDKGALGALEVAGPESSESLGIFHSGGAR